MQGWRSSMEDAHFTVPYLGKTGEVAVFGVFDGHGGEQVARFCERHLPEEIAKRSGEDVAETLVAAFFQMDQMLADPRNLEELRSLSTEKVSKQQLVHPDFMGCTASVCFIQRDLVVVANAGDCRAFLSRGGTAIDMSEDHKPNLPAENARIQKAGGSILKYNVGQRSVYRINGDLSLSRAIGDLRYKKNKNLAAKDQMVCCMPDIRIFKRLPEDEFMVIACDGVWDVLNSQEVVDYVRPRLGRVLDGTIRLQTITESLLDHCLSPDLQTTCGVGGDNMTMMLVVFTSTCQRVPTKDGTQAMLASLPSIIAI
jgi:protein phosphatase 1G